MIEDKNLVKIIKVLRLMNMAKDKKFIQLLALSRSQIILLLGIQSEI
jgi:hypothetical protein